MSDNIKFVAEREIQIVRTGKIEIQRTYYGHEYQTPTKITIEILNSDDPIQAYKDYVIKDTRTVTVQEFNNPSENYTHDVELSLKGKTKIKPTKIYEESFGKLHIKQFDDWLSNMVKEGWTIKAIIQ